MVLRKGVGALDHEAVELGERVAERGRDEASLKRSLLLARCPLSSAGSGHHQAKTKADDYCPTPGNSRTGLYVLHDPMKHLAPRFA